MVCCALCTVQSGFGFWVGAEEMAKGKWWWGRGVEMDVVEGEEEEDDGKRGGG